MGEYYVLYSLNGNWADNLNDAGWGLTTSLTSALTATTTLSYCLGLVVGTRIINR
eukprot:UN10560